MSPSEAASHPNWAAHSPRVDSPDPPPPRRPRGRPRKLPLSVLPDLIEAGTDEAVDTPVAEVDAAPTATRATRLGRYPITPKVAHARPLLEGNTVWPSIS